MKNLVKAIDRGEGCEFAFLLVKFPRISMEKFKAGIFDGPQIRELMKDPMLDEALSEAKLFAWQSLKSVVTNFLGNYRSIEYEKEIEDLLKSFRQLGAPMSVIVEKLNKSSFGYYNFILAGNYVKRDQLLQIAITQWREKIIFFQ